MRHTLAVLALLAGLSLAASARATTVYEVTGYSPWNGTRLTYDQRAQTIVFNFILNGQPSVITGIPVTSDCENWDVSAQLSHGCQSPSPTLPTPYKYTNDYSFFIDNNTSIIVGFGWFSKTLGVLIDPEGDGLIYGGALTPIASFAPEPGAWTLMIGGMGLAGAALRRRRGSRAARNGCGMA